ncbi:hypothetical protein QFC24_006170 [Naganishia onofrii]|uniref:Uncharacterized protein n=1 Tax=Naganishia onofrii TaxID=1851511 RepID=A0ACC2X6Y5_9TREE|nr:hypothetical protein QFC24_006170 [Naganishia onofrii]
MSDFEGGHSDAVLTTVESDVEELSIVDLHDDARSSTYEPVAAPARSPPIESHQAIKVFQYKFNSEVKVLLDTVREEASHVPFQLKEVYNHLEHFLAGSEFSEEIDARTQLVGLMESTDDKLQFAARAHDLGIKLEKISQSIDIESWQGALKTLEMELLADNAINVPKATEETKKEGLTAQNYIRQQTVNFSKLQNEINREFMLLQTWLANKVAVDIMFQGLEKKGLSRTDIYPLKQKVYRFSPSPSYVSQSSIYEDPSKPNSNDGYASDNSGISRQGFTMASGANDENSIIVSGFLTVPTGMSLGRPVRSTKRRGSDNSSRAASQIRRQCLEPQYAQLGQGGQIVFAPAPEEGSVYDGDDEDNNNAPSEISISRASSVNPDV